MDDDRRLRALVQQAVAHELRKGDVVARITEADVHRIADEVLERLEARLFPALGDPGDDPAPRARRAKRAGSTYFPPSV